MQEYTSTCIGLRLESHLPFRDLSLPLTPLLGVGRIGCEAICMPRVTVVGSGFRVTVEETKPPLQPSSPASSEGSYVVVDPPAASSVPQASDHPLPLPPAASPTRVLRASRVCEGSPSTSAPSYTSRRLLPVAPPFVPSSSSEPEYPLQGPVPEAPDSLPTVVPAQVLVLGRRLGSCENLSGEDRIRRAWKAGREAAEVLEGRKSRPEASPRLPLTNRVYCILRVTDLVCPRVVHSFSEYKAFPGILSDPRSVSHAFPSDSEARAFFAGASLPYPQ